MIDYAKATRKETSDVLENQGFTGAALEALLQETGLLRHQTRTQMAYEAIYSEASKLAEAGDDPSYEKSMALFLSLAIAQLDAAGIGGRCGVAGDGTLRVPCLQHLGSGRKQARDGKAWTAAIAAAGIRFQLEIEALKLSETPHGLGFYSWGYEVGFGIIDISEFKEWRDRFDGDIVSPLEGVDLGAYLPDSYAPWLRTLTREGMRSIAGFARWHSHLNLFGPTWPGAYNRLNISQ